MTLKHQRGKFQFEFEKQLSNICSPSPCFGFGPELRPLQVRIPPSFPSELLRSDFGFAALENLTPDGDGKPMPQQDKRADSGRILSIDGLDFLARILRRPEKSWKGRRFPSPAAAKSGTKPAHIATEEKILLNSSISKNCAGFSLIELLMSITIILLIVSVIYFCLNSALESWSYSSDQLSLQKVLSETIDTIINGKVGEYGLKDSLQMMEASKREVDFVPPWVDDTHSAQGKDFIYSLNREVKPGAPVPVAQVYLSESRQWRLAPVASVDLENSDKSQVQLLLEVPDGTPLRFIYHPNPDKNQDLIKKISWDEKEQAVYIEDQNGKEIISQNMFGVKITKMEISYYTNTNQVLTDRENVDETDVPIITGAEVFLEAKINQHTQSLKSFISLRNAPMRTARVLR